VNPLTLLREKGFEDNLMAMTARLYYDKIFYFLTLSFAQKQKVLFSDNQFVAIQKFSQPNFASR